MLEGELLVAVEIGVQLPLTSVCGVLFVLLCSSGFLVGNVYAYLNLCYLSDSGSCLMVCYHVRLAVEA